MIRSCRVSSVALMSLLLFSQAHGGGIQSPSSASASHQIQAILDSINATSVHAYLDTLVAFTYRHTLDDTTSLTTGIGAARRWVFRKFQEFSVASGGRLQPQYFDFTATICGVTRLHRNVMAVLPGTITPNRYFVVSGHLDTRGDPNSSCAYNIISPGANDDGSGTAVSLELARVLSRYQFDASLIFMAVVGEDEGLVGSEAYAAYAQANGIRIDGMITNDVVGNITGSNGITDSLSVRHFSSVNDATPHRQLARAMRLKTQQYYPAFTINLIPDVDRPGRGGDHQSFQNHGYTAVRFTEPNENLAFQHTPADIVANLSPSYVARIARVNALGLAALSWAPEKPSAPTIADPGNGTSLQVQWPSSPSVPDFGGYRVAVRDSGGLFYAQVVTAGNTTQHTVTSLTPGVAVYISVSAYDTAGNESIFSNETLARPAIIPSAPSGISSTSHASTVQIVWNPNPQLDVVKYRIYRSASRTSGFLRYDSVTVPTAVYTDNGLSPHQLRFYQVRAVDADGNESAASATVAGQLATHDRHIMIVDGTRDGAGGPLAPTDSIVDAAYRSLLTGFAVMGEWDVADSMLVAVAMSDAEMAPYSTVVWHSDVRNSNPLYADTSAIRKYLQQGGRLVLSGWKLSSSFKANAVTGLNTYAPGTFASQVLKIDSTSTNALSQDFYTAVAALPGYANIQVDSVTIPQYGGTLINTDVVLPPFNHGSAQQIYTHHGKTPGSPFEGKPVAWRYLGSDFQFVVFDFPLYYMQQGGARAALVRTLIDLGEPYVNEAEEGETGKPLHYVLNQNYPNPFNPTTSISFSLPKNGHVMMKVFDVLGRETTTLVNEAMVAGNHTVQWEARENASGMYFYRLITGTYSQSKKMLLLR